MSDAYSEKEYLNPMPVYNGALVRKMSSRNGKMFPGLMTDIMKVYQGNMGTPNQQGKMCTPEGVYFAQMLGSICQEEQANGREINKDTFTNLFVLHGVDYSNASKRMDDLESASAKIAVHSGYEHLNERNFFQDYGAFLAEEYGHMNSTIAFRNEDGTIRDAKEWVTDAKDLIKGPGKTGAIPRFFEYQNALYTESGGIIPEEQDMPDPVQGEVNAGTGESEKERGEETLTGVTSLQETPPQSQTQDEQYNQMRLKASARGIFMPAVEKLKGPVANVYGAVKHAIEKNKANKEARLLREPGALSKYMAVMANGMMNHKGKFAIGMMLATGGNLPATALALGAAKYISSNAMKRERSVLEHKDQIVTEGLKSAIKDLGWSSDVADETLSKFAGDANSGRRAELLQVLSEASLNQTTERLKSSPEQSVGKDSFDLEGAGDLHGKEQRAAYEAMIIDGGCYAQDRADEMMSKFDNLKNDRERHGRINQERRYLKENPEMSESNWIARINEVRDAIVKKYGAHPKLCTQQLLALGRGQTMRFDGKLADFDMSGEDDEVYMNASGLAETQYAKLGLSGQAPSIRDQYMDHLQNERMNPPLQVSDKMSAFDASSMQEQEKLLYGSLENMPEKEVLNRRLDQRRSETLCSIYERFGPGEETAVRMEEYIRTHKGTYNMDKETTFTFDEMSAETQRKATDRLACVERDYLSKLKRDVVPIREFTPAADHDTPVDCTGNKTEIGGVLDVTGDEYDTPKHKVQVATAVLQNGDTEDDAAHPNMARQLEEKTDTNSYQIIDSIASEDTMGMDYGI